ncbi:hypothetical protein ACFLW1_00180 [Chloroflexota bacterium]
MHDKLLRLIDVNNNRLAEGLRVLEEVARDDSVILETDGYRQARFQLYTLEKEIPEKLSQ